MSLENIIRNYNVHEYDPNFDINHFISYYDYREGNSDFIPANTKIPDYYRILYRNVEADYVDMIMRQNEIRHPIIP